MMKKIITFLLLLFALTSYEVHAQATCDGDDITINVGVATGDETTHASSTIVTESGTSIVIANGAEAHYKAGTSITLNAGFKVELGAEFSASIEICVPKPFVTKWQTLIDNESISIPTIGPGYNYEVDWSYNGVTFNVESTNATSQTTHTYDNAGTHIVAIRGDFPRINFGLASTINNAAKIIDIIQWGDIEWDDMYRAFQGCTSLGVISATDAPDLSQVISMSNMFYTCINFNGEVNHWVVDNIEDMSGLFYGTSFDKELSLWNVDKVKDMSGLFYGTPFNESLSDWTVTNVTDMSSMFQSSFFNQDISLWEVGNVTDMSYMFHNADNFNNNNVPIIWNNKTTKVLTMEGMFYSADNFDQDINNWDVSSVINMKHMFQETSFNKSLNLWNVEKVENMSYMFTLANNFDGNISTWVPKKVKDMSYMFYYAENFDSDISGWNVESLENMESMFWHAEKFNRAIGNWDVEDVTNMDAVLGHAEDFDQDLGDWEIFNVSKIGLSYSGITKLNYESILSKWSLFSGTSRNVELDAVGLIYCSTVGRDVLTDPGLTGFNWTITGDVNSCARNSNSNIKEPITATNSIHEIASLVYPNPVKDFLNINLDQSRIKNAEIIIMDVSGRVVLKEQGKTILDVSHLKTGIYFIEVSAGEKNRVKFIKM